MKVQRGLDIVYHNADCNDLAVPEPISEYLLADPYSWLEAHSGFTSSYSSTLIANSSNSSTNVTPSSASGK